MSDPSLVSLETTLEQSFPGLVVLDHDLELSSRYSADLVAMERGGRLVLVLLVEAGGDAPVLAALDAIAFARHNAGVLSAHFDEPRLSGEQAPRVILVAQSFSPDVAERFRPLSASSVELYEVRQVKSARGERVYLAPVGGGPSLDAAPLGRSEAFFASLPTDVEAIARECVRRLERIDEEIAVAARAGRAAFAFRGRDLARLELADGRLAGSVAPDFEPRALRSAAQVDLFVEEVLGHYVETLGAGERRAAAPAPLASAGLGRPGPAGAGSPRSPGSPGSPGDEHDDPRGPFADSEPLLSPEELRAFQE